MRKFSKNLLDFEKKSSSFILYQNKIKAGDKLKQPVYEYIIKKN
jgi:hypothetical protein